MLRNLFGYENVIKVSQKWSLKVYVKSDILILEYWNMKVFGNNSNDHKHIYRAVRKCPWSKASLKKILS